MFEDLIKLLHAVAQGDSDALDLSNMQPIEEGKPSKYNLTLTSL